MLSVLDERTAHIIVVLEDIYQSHNASAVLRSCDCFGIQHVHFIENRNTYQANPKVELGSAQWLSLTRHREKQDNTEKALQSLRRQGYRIIATTPHGKTTPLEELPVEEAPTAIVFGNELQGISASVESMADARLRIPLTGFAESFNISVACGICLHHLTWRLKQRSKRWGLGPAEKRRTLLSWLRNSVDRWETLEQAEFGSILQVRLPSQEAK